MTQAAGAIGPCSAAVTEISILLDAMCVPEGKDRVNISSRQDINVRHHLGRRSGVRGAGSEVGKFSAYLTCLLVRLRMFRFFPVLLSCTAMSFIFHFWLLIVVSLSSVICFLFYRLLALSLLFLIVYLICIYNFTLSFVRFNCLFSLLKIAHQSAPSPQLATEIKKFMWLSILLERHYCSRLPIQDFLLHLNMHLHLRLGVGQAQFPMDKGFQWLLPTG